MVRPLLPVVDGALVVERHVAALRAGALDWVGLMQAGCVEYLDVEEAGSAMIAMDRGGLTPLTTHMELHPSLALGVLASLIPFPDHNQVFRLYFPFLMLTMH